MKHRRNRATVPATAFAATLEPVALLEGEMDFAKYQAVLTEERGACGA
jgi:hypothetical protein